MFLKPLGERVLIQRKAVDKFGSIYIPFNAKKVNIGEVVAIGEDVQKLVVGDLITFGMYAPLILDASEMELYGVAVDTSKDHETLLLNESDALCVVMKSEEVA